MKKKILSMLLAFAMVFGLFAGMQQDAQADNALFVFLEDNLDCTVGGGMTVRQYISLAFDEDWLPGNMVKPGESIDFECAYFFADEAMEIDLPTDVCEYFTSVDEYYEVLISMFHEITNHRDNLFQSEDDEMRAFIETVPAAPAGYDAWMIQSLAQLEGLIYILYPVKLAPDTRDCELTSQNGTTTWKDYYGKTVWTITEKENAITADLSDWAAIPDAIVKAWKESGKAINLSYLWKGYSVSLSIPAGEIARTGEDWYGAEYIAKVNEQYVTVKDWFGQIVSTDVLY